MNYFLYLVRLAVTLITAVAAAVAFGLVLSALAPTATLAMAATGDDNQPLAACAPQPGGSPALFVVGGADSARPEPAVPLFRLRPL